MQFQRAKPVNTLFPRKNVIISTHMRAQAKTAGAVQHA